MVLVCIVQCQAYGIFKRELQEKENEEKMPIQVKIAVDENISEEDKDLTDVLPKSPASDLILQIFIKTIGNMSPSDFFDIFKSFIKVMIQS